MIWVVNPGGPSGARVERQPATPEPGGSRRDRTADLHRRDLRSGGHGRGLFNEVDSAVSDSYRRGQAAPQSPLSAAAITGRARGAVAGTGGWRVSWKYRQAVGASSVYDLA